MNISQLFKSISNLLKKQKNICHNVVGYFPSSHSHVQK